MLEELRADGDAEKQAMYQSYQENGLSSYTLKVDMQFLESSPLLDRAQNKPDVEGSLRHLRKRRLEHQKNTIYIPPQAKASLQAPDEAHFPLMEAVLEFMNSDQHQVLLLLGDSGAGKSTFNKALECDLWNSYKKSGPIPLHISLPAIDKPDQDMIAKQLRRLDFTDAQIKELKDHREFILICDGYDECQQTRNLYNTNQLNQPDEWKAKMVISCRSEYIGADYRDRFQPGDRNRSSNSALLQEAVIMPFSTSQVEEYIDQYVAVYQPLWRADDYLDSLERIPSLSELVANPFLMTLLLDVLPRMMDPGEDLSVPRITRVVLYDQFIEQWLERGKRRLGEKELSPNARAAFDSLSDEGFTINGIDFLKKLSVAIYKEQNGQPIVEYSRFRDEGSWKSAFFGRSDDKYLLREACPLARNGNQYRFIHRSMLEYGLARAIYDPQDWKEKITPQPDSNRRGSMSSVFSFEIDDTVEQVVSAIDQGPDPNSPLVWRSFVNESSLLQFLVELAQHEEVFKSQLLDYIAYSKVDKKWRIAAANAITILVRAGIQFIYADLRGVRIPGADLSHGMFHSADLQDADMRKVDLQGAWLRLTDFSRADMTGVQFGESPFVPTDGPVLSCVFSPDGNSLAVGLRDGYIDVYSTTHWDRIQTLEGHEDGVNKIAYSPDGNLIVSASWDNTARIWVAESGVCQHVLTDHPYRVQCVSYSPHGNQFASASFDKKVRLWDPATGKCCRILTHPLALWCAVYSSKGDQIASGCFDYAVRLWNVATGECSHIFDSHNAPIYGIAVSPQGDQIASSSGDKTIRLWDVESGKCRYTLEGHTSNVNDVIYSPEGDQIFSVSRDGTVRVWDVQSGTCHRTMTGHGKEVKCVAYSPKGDMVVSGGWDNAVRQWDPSARGSQHISKGHSARVKDIKYSPNGNLIATCSYDNTIRLWDAATGIWQRTIRGHYMEVHRIAFSPQGNRICSGSNDKTVRVWDVDTGICQYKFTDHPSKILSLAYSPQGDRIVSVSRADDPLFWNPTTGEHYGTLIGHQDSVLSIVYSPDGSLIATGSIDTTVKLWSAETMLCINTLCGHLSWVQDVKFSPQGDQLATASDDWTVRLWDVETGDCCWILIGHDDVISCVAYSPKGDILASGSGDKSVRLWDLASGQCLRVVQYTQDKIHSVAWIPTTEANYMMTGCDDGSIFKWEIIEEKGQWRAKLCWCATDGSLSMKGACVQGARGLSSSDRQLLRQLHVDGEPARQARI